MITKSLVIVSLVAMLMAACGDGSGLAPASGQFGEASYLQGDTYEEAHGGTFYSRGFSSSTTTFDVLGPGTDLVLISTYSRVPGPAVDNFDRPTVFEQTSLDHILFVGDLKVDERKTYQVIMSAYTLDGSTPQVPELLGVVLTSRAEMPEPGPIGHLSADPAAPLATPG